MSKKYEVYFNIFSSEREYIRGKPQIYEKENENFIYLYHKIRIIEQQTELFTMLNYWQSKDLNIFL